MEIKPNEVETKVSEVVTQDPQTKKVTETTVKETEAKEPENDE